MVSHHGKEASIGIEHSTEPVPNERLVRTARDLVEASTLCAIATVAPDGGPYVNTAYFACMNDFRLVWLSHPDARHSQNLAERTRAAIVVYDSSQNWGKPDRGIQLFGEAREVGGSEAYEAARVYGRRFSEYEKEDLGAYRFYLFAPDQVKLFDEPEFGPGRFVVAYPDADGGLRWASTLVYSSGSG